MFPIDVRYSEVTLKSGLTSVIVLKTEEEEKKYEGKVKELHTQWLQPSWKENNDVIRQSQIWDEFRGERTLDFYLYRSIVLDKFLKTWDITNDKNEPVPCNSANISKLSIPIANELIDQFISKNVPKEAELKNLAFEAHKYYTNNTGQNELPPDICIEVALWDRFHWGPKDTESMSLKEMRKLFIILQQQHVSRDKVENFQASPERHEQMMAEKFRQENQQMNAKTGTKPSQPKKANG